MPAWWRRARRQFGISAPRMSVHSEAPWWSRGLVIASLGALVAATSWWAFDFGTIFGRVERSETEARLATLASDNEALRAETARLRARASQLESDLAIAKGAQEATARQRADLASENAQLKDEAAFLRQLFADGSKHAGVSMPRLSVERESDAVWRYSLLIARGGNPRDEFAGRVVLQATVQGSDAGAPASTLALPDDEPDTAPMLKLAFKYYQRVEGTFHVPPGSRVTALDAMAFENGSDTPSASRSATIALTNP